MQKSTHRSLKPWQRTMHISRWLHLEPFRGRKLLGPLFRQTAPGRLGSGLGHLLSQFVTVVFLMVLFKAGTEGRPGVFAFELFLITAAITLTDGFPLASDRRSFLSTLPVSNPMLLRGRLAMALHRAVFEFACLVVLASWLFGISWFQESGFGLFRLAVMAGLYAMGVLATLALSIPETERRGGLSKYRREMIRSQGMVLLAAKWSLPLFSGLHSGLLRVLELCILGGLLGLLAWTLRIQLRAFGPWKPEDQPVAVDAPVLLTWLLFLLGSDRVGMPLGSTIASFAVFLAVFDWVFRKRSEETGSRKTTRRFDGLLIGLLALLVADSRFGVIPVQLAWVLQLAQVATWIGLTVHHKNSQPNPPPQAPLPPMKSAAEVPSHLFRRDD